jgi:hypothetical protein
MNTPTPTPRTDTEITFTGAYTCTHHNDAERTACPVCLVTALTAERDHLHAQLHALTLICGTNDANKFETWIDRANARAERAEAAKTVALANWNGVLERALKAEADLVALAQCHDDNCRALVKIDAELTAEREKSERYRLATLKQDAELATERARLDWVFRNCKVEANDFTTGNRDVYAIHDREDLGAAMKEDAK